MTTKSASPIRTEGSATNKSGGGATGDEPAARANQVAAQPDPPQGKPQREASQVTVAVRQTRQAMVVFRGLAVLPYHEVPATRAGQIAARPDPPIWFQGQSRASLPRLRPTQLCLLFFTRPENDFCKWLIEHPKLYRFFTTYIFCGSKVGIRGQPMEPAFGQRRGK